MSSQQIRFNLKKHFNPDSGVADPSGGPYKVCWEPQGAQSHVHIEKSQGETDLEFSVKIPDGYTAGAVTYFRFCMEYPDGHGPWAAPIDSPPGNTSPAEGREFKWIGVSDGVLTIRDLNVQRDLTWNYILEISLTNSDGTEYYVIDPEITNDPEEGPA